MSNCDQPQHGASPMIHRRWRGGLSKTWGSKTCRLENVEAHEIPQLCISPGTCFDRVGTLMSHASACNDSTIRGSYAFTIHGTIFLPDGSTLLIDGIDKITFDGKGTLRQVDAVATNGILAPGCGPALAPTL
jgi:hypothetical protein